MNKKTFLVAALCSLGVLEGCGKAKTTVSLPYSGNEKPVQFAITNDFNKRYCAF